MTTTQIIFMAAFFFGLLFFYKFAGRLIKKMRPKTIKTINWAGFIIAIVGGAAWYFAPSAAFMLVTIVGVVIYFSFYNYDRAENKDLVL